jgi:hypothetical protein
MKIVILFFSGCGMLDVVSYCSLMMRGVRLPIGVSIHSLPLALPNLYLLSQQSILNFLSCSLCSFVNFQICFVIKYFEVITTVSSYRKRTSGIFLSADVITSSTYVNMCLAHGKPHFWHLRLPVKLMYMINLKVTDSPKVKQEVSDYNNPGIYQPTNAHSQLLLTIFRLILRDELEGLHS